METGDAKGDRKGGKKHIAAGKRGFYDKAGERDGGMVQACI